MIVTHKKKYKNVTTTEQNSKSSGGTSPMRIPTCNAIIIMATRTKTSEGILSKNLVNLGVGIL
jgi:hypothetical protein